MSSQATVRVFLALGSNLGDRHALLARAREALDRLPGTRLTAASRIEETPPLGGANQPDFLNQMVALETTMSPHQLLDACLGIEKAAGRDRAGRRWAPRTLDLDIVYFGDQRVADDRLTIPHPELPNREFWQRELAELNADD